MIRPRDVCEWSLVMLTLEGRPAIELGTASPVWPPVPRNPCIAKRRESADIAV